MNNASAACKNLVKGDMIDCAVFCAWFRKQGMGAHVNPSNRKG